MHLWDVPIDDELVRNAQSEIQEILENNLNAAEQALHVYDNFLFILKEKARIENFLADSSKYKREDFLAEIQKYDDTIKKIRETMPFEIRMNMFLIDCAELNNRLCQECEELIERILQRTAEYIFLETSASITGAVKQINESFQNKANNSKDLVRMEKELDEIKNIKKGQLFGEYNDLVEWLILLYNNPRYKVVEE